MWEELKRKHKHKRCHEMKQMKYIVNYRNETNKHKWPLIHSKKTKQTYTKWFFSLGKSSKKIYIRARLYNMYFINCLAETEI